MAEPLFTDADDGTEYVSYDGGQNWLPYKPSLSWGEKRRMMVQGATLDFGDEIIGALEGGPGQRDYTRVRDTERMKVEEARSRAPLQSMAYEMAGGLAVPGVGTGMAVGRMLGPRIPGWIAALTGSAGTGAVSGGVAGAGTTEAEQPGQIATAADYIEPVAIGAGTGAATGAVVGGVVPPVARNTIGTAVGQTINRMRPNQVARNTLVRRLEAEGWTPDQIEAALGRGAPEQSLVDVSPGVRRDVEGHVAQSDEGRDIVERNLGMRAERAGDYASDAVRPWPGSDRLDTLNVIEDMQERSLSPQYHAARNTPIPVENQVRLDQLLGSSPTMQKLWERLQRDSAEVEAVSGQPLLVSNETGDPTFEGWKRMMTRLNRSINGALQKGELEEAAQLRNLRVAVNDQLDEALPGYRELRNTWADSERAKEVMTEGRKFITMDPQQFKLYYDDLNPAERPFFKVAVADAIRNEFHTGARRGRRGVSSMRKQAIDEKLRVLYADDPKKADDALELFESLQKQQSAYEQLTRGSPTARKLSAMDSADAGIHGAVVELALGVPQSEGALRSGVRWLSTMGQQLQVPESVRQRIIETATSGEPGAFLEAWRAMKSSTTQRTWKAVTGGQPLDTAAALVLSAGVQPALNQDQ